MEGIHVHTLDLGSLFGDAGKTAESAIVQFFLEVRRRKPGIVFIPNMHTWWTSLSENAIRIFADQMEQIPPHDSILLLATGKFTAADVDLKTDIQAMLKFRSDKVFQIHSPSSEDRREYFVQILSETETPIPGVEFAEDGTCSVVPLEFAKAYMPAVHEEEAVEKAPPPPPKKFTAKDIRLLHEYDESIFRRLRILLRDFMHELLRSKEYKSLTKNLNVRTSILAREISYL